MTSRKTRMNVFTAQKPFLFACAAVGLLLLGRSLPAYADPLYIGYNPGAPPTGTTEQVVAPNGVNFSTVGPGSIPTLVDDPVDTASYSQYNGFVHNDQSPFKGAAVVDVTNTGTQSWVGFNFQIFSLYPAYGWSKPADVFFNISGPYAPTYSNSVGGPTVPLDSATLTPAVGLTGAMLDLSFTSNPVAPGQTAVFTVYADNSQDQGLFGLAMYPTAAAVPVPAAIWLLGPGIAGLIAVRRRFIG